MVMKNESQIKDKLEKSGLTDDPTVSEENVNKILEMSPEQILKE